MNSCEVVANITAIACAISKDKTNEELEVLSSLFTQLGDTLSTIATLNEACNSSGNE